MREGFVEELVSTRADLDRGSERPSRVALGDRPVVEQAHPAKAVTLSYERRPLDVLTYVDGRRRLGLPRVHADEIQDRQG